jgi:hypothetical protein
MTHRGHVKNGVIVLDSPAQLAEGVEVEIRTADELPPTWAEVFKEVIGQVKDLPADASVNHDHYLYGAPKK